MLEILISSGSKIQNPDLGLLSVEYAFKVPTRADLGFLSVEYAFKEQMVRSLTNKDEDDV